MENVKFAVEGDELVIRCNLKHRGGQSSTGKTTRIASTEGNHPVDGLDPNIKVSVNVYTK